jgi:predicted dinucleotide-utilizing enzyme
MERSLSIPNVRQPLLLAIKPSITARTIIDVTLQRNAHHVSISGAIGIKRSRCLHEFLTISCFFQYMGF